eukprot:5253462-Prymnesium_polylepis.1
MDRAIEPACPRFSLAEEGPLAWNSFHVETESSTSKTVSSAKPGATGVSVAASIRTVERTGVRDHGALPKAQVPLVSDSIAVCGKLGDLLHLAASATSAGAYAAFRGWGHQR